MGRLASGKLTYLVVSNNRGNMAEGKSLKFVKICSGVCNIKMAERTFRNKTKNNPITKAIITTAMRKYTSPTF